MSRLEPSGEARVCPMYFIWRGKNACHIVDRINVHAEASTEGFHQNRSIYYFFPSRPTLLLSSITYSK